MTVEEKWKRRTFLTVERKNLTTEQRIEALEALISADPDDRKALPLAVCGLDERDFLWINGKHLDGLLGDGQPRSHKYLAKLRAKELRRGDAEDSA